MSSDNNLQSKDYFSDSAESYEKVAFLQSIGTRYLSSIETDFVKKYFLKSKDIRKRCLEIGPGTGRFTKLLLDSSFEVEAVEIAKGMIKKIKERFRDQNINIKNIDAGQELPYKSEYFDSVLAIRVLKYIPLWKTTLREVHRVLKPNGDFVFSIANVYSVARFKGRAKYFLFKPKEVLDYLRDLGFNVIKISTTTRLPFPVYLKINSRYWLNLIISLENILNKILPFWLFSRSMIIFAKKQSRQ